MASGFVFKKASSTLRLKKKIPCLRIFIYLYKYNLKIIFVN